MHEDVFGLVDTTIDGRYRIDQVVGEGGFAAPEPVSIAPTEPARTTGTSGVADAPSRDDTLAAMRNVEASVRLCALRGPSVKGIVEVGLTISGATGRVTNADVAGITGPVASCIRRVASTARFPRFNRPSFSIKYPYRF